VLKTSRECERIVVMRLKAASASFVLLTLAFLFVPKNTADAGVLDIFTNVIRGAFSSSDVRNTTTNVATSLIIDTPSVIMYGRNMDQVDACMALIANEAGLQYPTTSEEPTPTDDDCSDLRTAAVITGKDGYPTETRSFGSIMGTAIALEDVAINSAPVINLATYTRYMAAKTPVLNRTAFAAEGGNTLLDLFLDIWIQLRNIAYGALALFMVLIGIMVMFRQKVSSQAVVTVQYAIPRIAIAVVLITFSYPIGAFAFQLILPVSKLALSLLQPALSGVSTVITEVPTAALIPMIIGYIVALGQGVFVAVVRLVVELVILYFYIRLFIQVLISYVKIVLGVLTGPLVFAWSAIPGNEEETTNWFKRLGVNVVAVPAMFFILGINKYINATFLQGLLQDPNSVHNYFPVGLGGTGVGGTAFILVLVIAVIQCTLLFYGIKIPKTLEDGLKNGKK